ncbi:MAG: signal peptidase II [Clostridia bacterium]
MRRYWKLALAVVCLVAADQLTKYWAYAILRVEGPVVLIPGVFEFSYLENRGAAFGMMQGKFWLLIPITVITVAVILIYTTGSRTQSGFGCCALAAL